MVINLSKCKQGCSSTKIIPMKAAELASPSLVNVWESNLLTHSGH
jgi:hypothetical protein